MALIKEATAIIQARVTSTRLPNKVLMGICGKPMLWHIINRLKYAKKINRIILAIPDTSTNDVLVSFAGVAKLPCYRGSELDVLSRYYNAAREFGAELIVRIGSDCPLIDPQIVDKVIEAHVSSDADYTCNGVEYGFSYGLDTEVFSFAVLERAHKEAASDYDREHVTPYIYQHPTLFKLQAVQAPKELRRPDLHLAVDTIADLELIRIIYNCLYRDGAMFHTKEVIALINDRASRGS